MRIDDEFLLRAPKGDRSRETKIIVTVELQYRVKAGCVNSITISVVIGERTRLHADHASVRFGPPDRWNSQRHAIGAQCCDPYLPAACRTSRRSCADGF